MYGKCMKGDRTVLSSYRTAGETLDSLQTDLSRLKRELAEAWASPASRDRVRGIEAQIEMVWSQIDRLAVKLGEPTATLAPVPIARP